MLLYESDFELIGKEVKEMAEQTNSRREDILLNAPNVEGNVWPKQNCPAFEPREGALVGIIQCWYCRYADFHLGRPRALDVGVCYWPKKIMR